VICPDVNLDIKLIRDLISGGGRGVGSQLTNQPKTKQCNHLCPLIRWAHGGRVTAWVAAAAAAKQPPRPAAVATKTPVAAAMVGGGNNQQSSINLKRWRQQPRSLQQQQRRQMKLKAAAR
jgi:hypothetical protein